MVNQTALHNELAGKIVRSIVEPVARNGGTAVDVMVLTESVLVGVTLAMVKLGGDEAVLDTMVENARKRLAEIRLKDLPTKGQG